MDSGTPSRHEIKNLQTDSGEEKKNTASMSTVKDYIHQPDYKNIPQFLAQIAEQEQMEPPTRYSISLYEFLAREHGKAMIPYISQIMNNIVRFLSVSFAAELQYCCARVVSAIARYTIDGGSSPIQRNGIFRSILNPLNILLTGPIGFTAEGSAICIGALLETEAWKSAPEDVVNDVCLKVTSALCVRSSQTSSHIALVAALAEKNGLILEAFVSSLMKAAEEIVENEAHCGNWQNSIRAIEMLGSLLQNVKMDARDLDRAVFLLENWGSDRMPSLRTAARDVLQIARTALSTMDAEEKEHTSYANIRATSVLKEIDNFNCFTSPHSHLTSTTPNYKIQMFESGAENECPSSTWHHPDRSVRSRLHVADGIKDNTPGCMSNNRRALRNRRAHTNPPTRVIPNQDEQVGEPEWASDGRSRGRCNIKGQNHCAQAKEELFLRNFNDGRQFLNQRPGYEHYVIHQDGSAQGKTVTGVEPIEFDYSDHHDAQFNASYKDMDGLAKEGTVLLDHLNEVGNEFFNENYIEGDEQNQNQDFKEKDFHQSAIAITVPKHYDVPKERKISTEEMKRAATHNNDKQDSQWLWRILRKVLKQAPRGTKFLLQVAVMMTIAFFSAVIFMHLSLKDNHHLEVPT